MAEVYAAVTDRILINLAKYFPYVHNSGEMRGSFEYQARMLAQMGKVTRESVEIIAGSLGNADAALRTSLTNAIIDALKTEEPKLRRAAEQGLLGGITGQITPNQMQAFSLYYKQSADKLNLVNTVMLESTQTAYSATVSDVAARIQQIQGALNTGAGEVITGVSTWNQAMREAVQKMVKSGITGFIDHGGHHWSPEAYAAMDIRTTLFNTSRAAVWERNEDYGNDLYQVSSHNGARPLCYPWQGKVISRDDLSREVEDLDGNTVHVYAQSETTYGEAAGLFGVNCGHYPMVFIPGVSTLREVPQDEEENAKTYAESQQQRALERKLREEKRDLEVLKAQGASEEEIKAQRDKVRKASGDIDRFCDETGRTRDRSREYTPINATWPDQEGYTPPTTPAPQIVQPLQSSESVVQLATEAKPTIADVTDFQSLKTYMDREYGITVTSGVKKLDQQLVKEALTGLESVVKDFPDIKTGLDKIQVGGSGVMTCTGGVIKFKSDYFTAPKYFKYITEGNIKSHFWVKNASAGSIGAHETAHAVEMLLINLSGKYTSPESVTRAWNNGYEAARIVSSACQAIQATAYGSGKTNFELIQAISSYAQRGGASETMAEAFADVFANGENANPLSKEIRKRTLDTYLKYKGGNP